MRKFLLAAFLALANLAAAPYAPMNNIPNVASLSARDWSSLPSLTLDGYYTANDGGGGPLKLGTCTPDGGSCFSDGAGHTFQRTNMNGDLRQWGVTKGSVYDAAFAPTTVSSSSAIYTSAFAVMSAAGLTQFSSGGVSAFWATTVTQPANSNFTCGLSAGGPISNGYYVGLPGTIMLAHGAVYQQVNNKDAASLDGCIFIPQWYANTSAVSGFSGYSFTSPPLVEADLEAMRGNMTKAGDVAIFINNSEGAKVRNVWCYGFDNCIHFNRAHDLNIDNAWMDANVDVYGDGGGGQSDSSNIDSEPFIVKQANINNVNCTPNGSTSSSGVCNEEFWNITAISAAGTNNSFGNPECSVQLGYANSNGVSTTGWPGSDLQNSATFSNGDAITFPAWIANLSKTVSGGNANALGCLRSFVPMVITSAWDGTHVTVTLKGTSYSTGGTKITDVASWPLGASALGTTTAGCSSGCGIIRIVSGDVLNIQKGMIVADDGAHGIPVSSTVVAVVRSAKGPDRYDGYITTVFINNPTTIASVDATITFDGGTFTSTDTCDGHGKSACLFINAAERFTSGASAAGQAIQTLPIANGHHFSSCYFANGTPGFRQNNAFCYGHDLDWVFNSANNYVLVDAHNDDNGELDCLFCTNQYVLGSTSYGSTKGNGFGKASSTVIDDQYSLNQSASINTTTNATVTGVVGTNITTAGSFSTWPNDSGTPGLATGKLTVAMCQTIGSDPDCSNQNDLQYFTVEQTNSTTMKILACGQFYTACAGYTSGAKLFFVIVGSAAASVSYSHMTTNVTDVGLNTFELDHGGMSLDDISSKGGPLGFYVSQNANPFPVQSVVAPLTDMYFDGAIAATLPQGCGNTFSTSQAWQCNVNGVLNGVFTATGATTSTTLPDFGDRALSILDFNTAGHPAVPDCSTSATSALAAAETSALAQGVHIIRLDGTAVGSCYAIGTHTVPAGITLFCPGPPAVEPTNNDFRNSPNAIALTTNSGITLSKNSFIDCPLIVRSNLTTGAPPTDSQGNYARTAAYAGTAITFSGDGSGVRNAMVVGFATCFLQSTGRTFWIQNVQTDCNQRDKFLKANPGGMIFDTNGVVAPFGTRAGTGGPANQINIPFATAADAAGLIRIHLPSPCSTTNCPLTGEKIWIINSTPYQSAQGGWDATVIDTSNYDLQGSDSGFLAGKAFTGVTVTIGSNEITGLSLGSMGQVQPTQSVTGTCIPAGAQVMFREIYYGIIWLMDASGNPVNATCSSTPTETITITDQATGVTSITADAVAAGGSGYIVGDHLQPTGGTVVTGDDADLVVTAVDGSGAVTASPDIADGGSYTVCPADSTGVTDLTTPAATGATFHFACTGAVALYANNRTGAAFQLQNVNAVRVSNMNVLSNEICVEWDKSSNDIAFDGVACHDQNQLQDQTHHSIVLNGSDTANGGVAQNKFCNGGLYYFGGILDLSQSQSTVSSNIVCNSTILGPKGAGLQKTMLDVASPGGAKKNSLTLSGNSGAVSGLFFFPDDIRSAQLSDNDFPSSYLLGQSPATYGLLSGAGNHFASGSMAISPGATTLNTASAFAGGGQASATKLTADFVRVNAVATAGDSVMLRPAVAGAKPQTVTNASSRVMQVFGYVGTADTINGIASATGVPQAPGTSVQYSVTATGAYSATVIAPSGTNVLCPVSQPCIYSALQTVNFNTGAAPAPSASAGIQTVSNDAGVGATIQGDAYAAAMAFQGVRRDGTNASPTAVQSGDTVASFSARSYDGVSVPANSETYIRGMAAENQSATNHGHDTTVGCTPIGSSGTAQECGRFNSLFSQLEGLKFYGSAPAVTGTGSPTIASGSTDNAGEVTGGTSATSIIITFNVAKTNAPFCTVSPQTSVASFVYTISTTAITITQTATTGQKVDYVCSQH